MRAGVVLTLVFSIGCAQSPEPVMPAEPVRTPPPGGEAAVAKRSDTPPARELPPSPTPTRGPTEVNRSADASGASPETAEVADPRAQVRSMVEAWRAAWERKDLEAYLAHYARDFEGDGRDLAAWSAHKRRVFRRAGTIRVEVRGLTIEIDGADVVARFEQRYSSGRYADRGRKTLELVRRGGRYQIRRESFAADG